MSKNGESRGPETPPVEFQGDPIAEWRAGLNRLQDEKDALGREVVRCQEQLNLVFDITGRVSSQHDTDVIESALLEHYGTILRANAVFVDRAGCCQRVETQCSDTVRLEVRPEWVRQALAERVEKVRVEHRPILVDGVPDLHGAHALLGVLQRADAETGVILALRAKEQPPFDPGDILASESILAYGAQALSNALMVRHLQRTALQTVCTLVNAIDAKDNYTSDHSERVGWFARLTGQALGLPGEHLQTLEWAGLLHDVGKIGISEHILNKPGRLTLDEFEYMKKHSRIGYDVLKPVTQFESVLEAVLYHHENHDGTGYPEGHCGKAIPLEARIIHVVDIFDALTTNRPYRRGYDFEQAICVLNDIAGRVTDSELTLVFVNAIRRYRAEQPDEFLARLAHLVGAGGEPGITKPARATDL